LICRRICNKSCIHRVEEVQNATLQGRWCAHGCTFPRCSIFGDFEPEERESIIRDMCPSGEDMGQVTIPVVVA
jgi:hypothetical protein